MIGVIVEGPSDEAVIKEICKKLNIKVEVRCMSGNDFKKARAFAKLLDSRGCKKVVILKDLEDFQPSDIIRKFEEARIREKANLCIVVRAIESWLLADKKAIEDYLEAGVSEVYNPEDLLDPAQYLEDVFKKAGRSYYKGGRDPAELARRLDLEKVRQKCFSFKQFETSIQN